MSRVLWLLDLASKLHARFGGRAGGVGQLRTVGMFSRGYSWRREGQNGGEVVVRDD